MQPGFRHAFIEGVDVVSDPDQYGDWILVAFAEKPWLYWVVLEDVDGVPQVTGLKLERRTQGGKGSVVAGEIRPIPPATPGEAVVTMRALQSVPLGFLARVAATHRAGDVDAMREEIVGFRSTRPAKWEQDHYEAVAEVYRAAVQRRRPPLKAVQTRFGVQRAMASRYVKTARELGLLGWPEKPGVPGTTNASSPISKEA